MMAVATFCGRNGLEIDMVSPEILEDEILSMVQDVKRVLQIAIS